MIKAKISALSLIDVTPNKFGAIEEYSLALSANLIKKGFFGAVAFTGTVPEWLKRKFSDKNVEILEVGINDVFNIKSIVRLRQIIWKYNINILHATFFSVYNFNILLSCIWNGCLLVHSDQDSRLTHPRKNILIPLRFFKNKLLQTFINSIIADADFIAKCQIQDFNMCPDKIKIIYNGVNTDRFDRNKKIQKDFFYKEFGLPINAKIVVTIAQLIPGKGLDYLLDAAYIINENNSNVYFFIIGEGLERKNLESKVDSLDLKGKVIFTGLRIDTELFLAGADMFVLLSVWEEAFAFSLLEAMASGCPIVATEIGAIPESVLHNKTGLLVPPKNSKAAAEAIQYLIDNDEARAQMGAAGRSRVVDHFSLQRWVSETIQFYEQITGV